MYDTSCGNLYPDQMNLSLVDGGECQDSADRDGVTMG
jgi:hypothetical protein